MENNTYVVSCRYTGLPELEEGDECIHAHFEKSTRELEEFCRMKQENGAPWQQVVKVVRIPPEIGILRDLISMQIDLWERMRDLERVIDADLDCINLIQEACVDFDSPVTLHEHEQLFSVMNMLQKENGIATTDYNREVKEL